MQGQMQGYPLTLVHPFERAERLFADKSIATAGPGGLQRTTYGEWAERTRRLGGVLGHLGVSPDGRVGTFAWNTSRHLELYFAARSEEHTSELQSRFGISYAVFCLKKK